MIDLDIEPTFTTARGRVGKWIDYARQWEAMGRHHDAFHAHGEPGAGDSSSPRRLPEADRAALIQVSWEADVRVRMPNLARMVARVAHLTPERVDSLQIHNPLEHLQCRLDGDKVISAFTQPTSSANREDLGAFCYGNYNDEALALLQPRCFLHGWRPVGELCAIDHFGRPAFETRLELVVPFSNPRMRGDHFNPNIFTDAELVDFVIDREQGVVLEWRALLDGEPYARHRFTELAFDVPLDDVLFDRSGIPSGVPIDKTLRMETYMAEPTATASSGASRVIAAPCDALYAAFTDPAALAAWQAPDEMTATMHAFDAREGGGYTMSLHYPASKPDAPGKTADMEDRYTARFVELTPPSRIVQAIEFDTDDPALMGEMTMTITFEERDGGTEVTIAYANVPPGIRPEDNDAGTRSSLEKLARYVGDPASRA